MNQVNVISGGLVWSKRVNQTTRTSLVIKASREMNRMQSPPKALRCKFQAKRVKQMHFKPLLVLIKTKNLKIK